MRRILEEGLDVVGVITQPDRPKGRHLVVVAPPVKEVAVKYSVPIFQPEKVCTPEFLEKVRSIEPDIVVVFAYREILTEEFLRIAKISTINLHLSLLPKYRGAAPVQWAIINGDKETGVTVMHIAKKLDTGDIIFQERIPISEDDTAGSLQEKLTKDGAELVIKAIKALADGTAPRVPQDESKASYARKISREDGEIDWKLSAVDIRNRVRGLHPWPCAYTHIELKAGRKLLKILDARVLDDICSRPGEIVCARESLRVAAGKGALEIITLQLEGKKEMKSRNFLLGHRFSEGSILG